MNPFCNCLRKCCSSIPQRFVVSFLVLTGVTIQFIHRTAFTLAITAITYTLNVTEDEHSQVCPEGEIEVFDIIQDEKREFHWSASEQFHLGSVFYIGYIISHLPGGILSDKYGPKRVLGYGCLLSAICSVLTPFSARINIYLLMLVRIISGLAQGAMFPAQSAFVARWALPDERNCLNSVMSLGINLGGVIGVISTGLMLSYFDNWDTTFFVLAGMTLIWYVFWVIFTYNTPDEHPFISENEREKIKTNLGDELQTDFKPSYIPVLKSVPLWAAIIASAGNDWVFFIILTLLPQYMAYVLHFDIEENGLLNALPFVAAAVFTIISPIIADCLLKSGIMGKTMQHKIFLFITNQGPCICVILASYSGCSNTLVVFLFSLAMGLTGVIYSSVRVTNVDLAPNLAGFTMALMNGVGALTGFLGPELFGLVITSHTVSDWRLAFWISCAIVTVSTVIYLIWGTSDIQAWNFPTRHSSNRVEAETEDNLKSE